MYLLCQLVSGNLHEVAVSCSTMISGCLSCYPPRPGRAYIILLLSWVSVFRSAEEFTYRSGAASTGLRRTTSSSVTGGSQTPSSGLDWIKGVLICLMILLQLWQTPCLWITNYNLQTTSTETNWKSKVRLGKERRFGKVQCAVSYCEWQQSC